MPNKTIWLVLHGAARDDGAWRIEEGRSYLVGRSSESQIRLADKRVSRRHAMLVRERGKLSIRDLKSRNGTFVNETPIKFAHVAVGVTLDIGGVMLVVQDRRPSESFAQISDGDTPPAERVDRLDTSCLGNGQKVSPSVQRILALLLDGKSEKEIAADVGRTPGSVHRQVKSIYKELGVHSRAQLLAHYLHAANGGRRR